MNSKVDVLAVLDRAYERLQDRGCEYARIIEARAAVAELIEAAKAYRDAIDARAADTYGSSRVYERAEVARARLDDALTRVTGA